jgi:peptidoglycan/LPS O-acetylase OafA/YrhL
MGRSSIGLALDPRRNSLNFIRLLLAGGVVYSHAAEVGWLGWRNVIINGTTLGTICVYGFFGISGYLIAGSATRNGVGRYLWQRFLRIFPGFWVCLLLTALMFGVIAWIKQPAPHCSVECYLGLYPGPVSYVYSNFFLKINQLPVSPQASGIQLSNGSLWTLFFEFLCYLFLAGLAFAGLLKRRGWVALISLGLFGALSVITLIPRFNRMFTYVHNSVLMQFLILSVIFMVGSVIYLYKDRVPDSGLLAAFCAVAFVASLHLPNDGAIVVFRLTKSTLGAFLIAYPMLWLGAHLPFHRIGARNDYSYGMYIYAYPITQLLVIFNAERFGFVPFIVLAFVLPIPFAVASWWIIEKRSLRLKKVPWPPSHHRQRSSTGTTELMGNQPASE